MRKSLLLGSIVISLCSTANAADVEKKQPMCKYPDKVAINFTTSEIVLINAMMNGQDFSHVTWLGLQKSLAEQEAAISKRYCK